MENGLAARLRVLFTEDGWTVNAETTERTITLSATKERLFALFHMTDGQRGAGPATKYIAGPELPRTTEPIIHPLAPMENLTGGR